jgi:Spy/CpxP family protein refolding chaperone
MNKRTKIVSAFLAASAIALAVPFAAQARPGGGFDGGGCEAHEGKMMRGAKGGGHRMLRQLDLTEAQRDKLFEMRHAMAPKMHAEMKTVRSTSQALRDMMQQGEYDEAQVKRLTEERAGAMSRMAQLRARGQFEMFQLLTPEQRTKWQELQSQRPRRGGMMPPEAGMEMDS